MAAAQAAAAKIAAAKVAAAKTNAAAAPATRRAPSNYTAATEPQQAQAWPATQRSAAANPAPASMAAPPSPSVPPTPPQDAAAAAPPAPVDVSEIVSALRKARASDAASAAGGAAPIDAAKVIAALLVSRAAKRQTTQQATAESGDAAAAVVPARAASSPATEPTASQAALMNRLRSNQQNPQSTPVRSDQPAAASGDPADALIEALRAHAARHPAHRADNRTAATGTRAMSETSAAAGDDELDDPAAALINLLQSRFSLPEDELEAERPHDEHEDFPAEDPQIGASMHDDPTAQLMSLLESRSSIPDAPPVVGRPQPQPHQQQRQHQQQNYQQQPQRPQQQRSSFVPSQFEDPATPPLDFIPRPQALRPRPHSIQHDESLDGIQDILARLGRRA